MTENCPLCKGKVSKEQKDHVLKELGKLALDPNYKMKTWSERD